MAQARKKARVLSDGTKPPAIPEWVWAIVLLVFVAFAAFAFSKPAYVFGFFFELWRNRAGG
jgi:hypothetical protein